MDGIEIVKALASKGYMVEPDALDALGRDPDPGILDRLVSGLDPSALTVTRDDVARSLRAGNIAEQTARKPALRILSDITNNSTCIGDYDEFVGYFRDRYGRLGDMMRHRISARPIESIKKKGFSRGEKSEVAVIGMVSDVRDTANGNRLVELEDRTGSMGVLISKDKDFFDSPLLLDEVVGVSGTVKEGGLLMASGVIYPDVPNTNVPRRSDEPAAVALISDVHIGSNTFLEDPWMRFIDWLNGDSDAHHDLASRLKYVVVAGDMVDGIGVYPGQEKELHIADVYDQYRKAAEYFDQFPRHLKIVIAPGNHDAVRQAEPQPALPEEVRRMFRHPNVTFAGNPSAVEMEGVRLLIYHGRSLDDLVSNLPGASYSKPEKAMAELLKRRHLSPIYGGKVMIAPEAKDHFVIDPLPDIMHSGHVHTVGVCRYRGVTLVNSGTWQSQTDFQKRMNIQPDPARIPIVDLQNGDVKIVDFGE
ncbi:family D DNA polymerase small subunit [Methanocella paludicola SANAE]|uniref:DNA polymerase II small subunit n=1 Tax=Methanocella paludicola (strain DSM 17711 / JCM 13418 / NBRC 101707 / SANAE) TaxID=304371 RepID=D1Z2Z8_METPS|nr:DNA-directed DNA polymerase II small subunit [Methanocella paludicola]BAI63070.1 family D DNA polymerase small subunit [Methanocella paludicola SANAE]